MNEDDIRKLAEDIAHDRVAPERAAELAAHPELRGFGSAFTEGRGTIDTRMVVRLLPSTLVAAMLPAGLQLAPQPLAPPGLHPLLLSFAEDSFGAWFGAMTYHEVMLAIPWVEYAEERMAHRGPFIYMPRLWLDQEIPRVLGNRVYGFEKLPGRITAADPSWEVREHGGDLLARAQFTSDGPARPPDGWPMFAWVRTMLEQPTISQVRRIVDDDARRHGRGEQAFFCSTVRYLLGGRDWNGADVHATVEPLRAELTFGDGLSLPVALPQDTASLPSLAQHELGGFRLRCPIVVSLPGSGQRTHYPRSAGRKLRVAVVGGGPSACSAAYWLARQREHFDVDVYTMGWRLGGKCAGSRNAAANDRIEEHGLHAFLGFYQNAFRTLRSLYSDIGWEIDADGRALEGAFIPRDEVGVIHEIGRKPHTHWLYAPTPERTNNREPGAIPPNGEETPGHIGEALRGLMRRVGTDVREWLDRRGKTGDGDLSEVVDTLRLPWQRSIERMTAWLDRETAVRIEKLVETPLAASRVKRWVVHLLDDVRRGLAWYYADASFDDSAALVRWGGLDILLTIAIGVLTESTLDFDDLDDRDFRSWLVEHGLHEMHHDSSTFMQVYETLFAHASDQQDIRFGQLACGVGLRWFLLLGFGFTGHIAWDFRFSCPETLITPYMLALERHEARVHFFHRLTAIELDGTGNDRRLARLRFALQARVQGDGVYRPFAGDPQRKPPAWPAEPDYAQLVDGGEIAAQEQAPHVLESSFDEWGGLGQVVLEQGRDFDMCVLAIPVGALPPVTRALTELASPQHDPRWRAMTTGISLIQTVSAQLWFDRDVDGLFDPPSNRGLLTGFAHPQSSLGQLGHLIAIEGWGATPPRTVIYHTGALASGVRPPDLRSQMLGYAKEQRAQWRERFEKWLMDNYREVFPRAPKSYEELLALLHVPDGATATTPPDRLAAQWFSIGCNPSDFYVLSLPAEMRLRMAPHESGVRFMMLAGDWTKTDLNCGCVEAATQSGMLVARALSGDPVYVWRVGF